MSSYYGSDRGSTFSPSSPEVYRNIPNYTESRSSYSSSSSIPSDSGNPHKHYSLTILAPPSPLKPLHTKPSAPTLRTPTPHRFEDQVVLNTLSYSDKIVAVPPPDANKQQPLPPPQIPSPSQRPSPSPILSRARSPLPGNFEIAVPPGTMLGGAILRPDTPDEILFHPNDERPRVGTPVMRSGTPVGRMGTPVDQMLFPNEGFSTPQSGSRGSPVPTVVESISAYNNNYYTRVSPAPSSAATMVGDSYSTHSHYKYDAKVPAISSPYELNGLWNAAQGAHPMNGDGKIYIMSQFHQTSPENTTSFAEHFTFGPSSNNPFYMLHAMPSSLSMYKTHNELSLRRKNPASGDMQSLARMALPVSGLPDPDGLVTLIYPKRAVVAAMSSPALSSINTSKTHAAICLAADAECCRLRWSSSRKRYELHHPAMALRNATDASPALIIRIEDGPVGFDTNGKARGSIKLINTTNMDTLAALDFARSLLFVNTGATVKVPSRHIVDVAVASLLAVGTMEGRRARYMAMSVSGSTGSLRSVPCGVRVETFGSVQEAREAQERMGKQRSGRCPGPGMVVVKLAKGCWMLIYFTGRLGYEIVKAIVDAFRPVPDRGRKSEKSRGR